MIVDEAGRFFQNLVIRLNTSSGAPSITLSEEGMKGYTSGWRIASYEDVAYRTIPFSPQLRMQGIPVEFLLPKGQVRPGAGVWILGYPMGIRTEQFPSPILRQGIVSMIDAQTFLLDAFVFPGNSGGPVVYRPTSRMIAMGGVLNQERVLGMVIEEVFYTDIAISPQTKHTRISFEENAGLAKIVPSDVLLDLLSAPEFRKIEDAIK